MAQVPKVDVEFDGDGLTTIFDFNFPYQKQSEIFVTVDEVIVTYTWVAGSNATVQLTVAPVLGAKIRIFRSTMAYVPLHVFDAGVPFLPRYVDENNRQLLYAVQEAINSTAGDAAEALVVAERAEDTADRAEAKVDAAIIDSSAKLRADLLDPVTGADNVRNSGRSVGARLRDTVNVQDVWAKQGGGTSWGDVFNIATDMASYNMNSAQRSGCVVEVPSNQSYDIADVVPKSGVVYRGGGPKNTRLYCTKTNGTMFKMDAAHRASGEYKSIGFEGFMFDGGVGTSGASQIASTAVNIGGMHHSWMRDCQLQRFNGKAILDDDAFVVDFLFDNIMASQNNFAFHLYNPLSTCAMFRHVYAVGNAVNWRLENIGEAELHGCKNEKSTAEGIGIYGPSAIIRITGGYSEDAALLGNRSQINIEGGASVGIRDHYMKYNAGAGSNLAHIVVNGALRTLIDGVTFNSDAPASGYDIAGSAGARNIFLGENHHIGNMARISPTVEARCYGANNLLIRGAAPRLRFADNNGAALASILSDALGNLALQDNVGNSLARFAPTGMELPGTWNGAHLIVGGFHIWAGSNALRCKFGAPASIDDGNRFTLS